LCRFQGLFDYSAEEQRGKGEMMNWYIEAQNIGPMRFRDLERVLQQFGFMNRGRNGPHFKFCNPMGRCVAVPGHREIPVGTVRNIIRQMGMVPQQFQEALRAASAVGPLIKWASDPLMNIRMLISGVQQHMSMLKRDPRFHEHFVSAQLQGLFVSCDASISKCMELCARYRDYSSAMERLITANKLVKQLVGELGRRTGFNISVEPVVKNIMEDFGDVYRELNKFKMMNSPKPPVAQPSQMSQPQPLSRSALG
jgi:predicted RNA binding protein YcfA (HicA-like mRNA interferase family)